MTPDQKALAVRKRFKDDFAFYASKAVIIRTKAQTLINLKLNRAQKHLLARIDIQIAKRGYVRMVILKGRQMGSSTFVESWLYFWVTQRKAQKALVVAHDITSTQNIFEMAKRVHDNCPEALKPTTRTMGRKELFFGDIDSGYRIATAGGDGIVRGDTITAAHLSEVAWWPGSSAKANFSGLMDSVPNLPGTAVFQESTANGFNLFQEQWEAAETGESDFEAVFLPWFWDDSCRAVLPKGFERSPQETALIHLYGDDGLTDAHLAFRRLKVAEKGLELFRQEYPCCAEEAFLTSGRPVFHPDKVAGMLREAIPPIAVKGLKGAVVDGKHKQVWENDSIGELSCYLPHDEQETYYIGADVGYGVRKDFSVAQVFDSKRRQAAVWRSDRVYPDVFGQVLAELGRYYNGARIICERNGPGQLVNHILSRDEGYSNLYRETVHDKVTDIVTEHVGFMTNPKSKPYVIDKLRGNIRDDLVTVYDRITAEELLQYILTETGKMEAEKGKHDDCVIGLALCDHINEGVFEPIVNLDAWYGTIE